MGLGGLADDRQPEPRARLGAGVAGAVEAIEDERQVGLLKAGAVVAHGQHARVQPDLDGALWRAPFGGIVEQVGHRPGDPVTLAADERGLQRGHDRQLRGAAAGPVDGARDDLVDADVARLAARLAAPCELDNVADQRGELVELLDHVGPQRLAILGREQLLIAHQLEIGADGGDRGPQLMRGVGDQVTLGLD